MPPPTRMIEPIVNPLAGEAGWRAAVTISTSRPPAIPAFGAKLGNEGGEVAPGYAGDPHGTGGRLTAAWARGG